MRKRDRSMPQQWWQRRWWLRKWKLPRRGVRAGGSRTSQAKEKVAIKRKGFPLQQDDCSPHHKRMRLEVSSLPKDLLPMILSHLPMRDAARAACVSRAFLHSWRYYPNLVFNVESLALNRMEFNDNETLVNFITTVDNVIRKHSGVGVKTFKLELGPGYAVHPSLLDRWLEAVSTLKMREFALELPLGNKTEYNFPYSLLFSDNRRGSLVQSFRLFSCAFHPPVLRFDCLRSLTSVHLSWVDITAEELACFLSNCFTLGSLKIWRCHNISFLKIPCVLQQLNCLQVLQCLQLKMIEINAPMLSSFHYRGLPIEISLGDSSQVKDVNFSCYTWSRMFYYARTQLPTIARNVENLFVLTKNEDVHAPLTPNKFVRLKYLEMVFTGRITVPPFYDFFSLVSFLDASPALETFILHVDSVGKNDSILEQSSELRHLPKRDYNNLRNVKITGVSSSKTLVELISHILDNTAYLECLTLDTRIYGFSHAMLRCQDLDFGDLPRNLLIKRELDKERVLLHSDLMEACRARQVIGGFIEGKVPSTVNLKIIEPYIKRGIVETARGPELECVRLGEHHRISTDLSRLKPVEFDKIL